MGFLFSHSLAVDEFHRTAARGIPREKREEGGWLRIARLAEATRNRKTMVVVEVEKFFGRKRRGRMEKENYVALKIEGVYLI